MRADMYVETVLKKCELFCSCALWSRVPTVRPRAWLENFDPPDRAVAAVLLDHFVFFSSLATDQLLASSLRRIASIIHQHRGTPGLAAFWRNVVFTPVLGEDPNPTDSGGYFCRKVRQLLAFDETRFLTLDQAHIAATQGKPIVLLDDFIGSGDQMDSTWKRESAAGTSFESIAGRGAIDASYVALVSTKHGYERLCHDLPSLRVVVSHLVDDTNSVTNVPSNPLVPDIDDVRGKIEELLEKYHPRLILPAYLNSAEQRKYGYATLGLILAFEHSVPDATIPLIWAPGHENWTPLARRA